MDIKEVVVYVKSEYSVEYSYKGVWKIMRKVLKIRYGKPYNMVFIYSPLFLILIILFHLIKVLIKSITPTHKIVSDIIFLKFFGFIFEFKHVPI